jgi:hypothetical protein
MKRLKTKKPERQRELRSAVKKQKAQPRIGRMSFKEFLLTMPNVGPDTIFERERHLQ